MEIRREIAWIGLCIGLATLLSMPLAGCGRSHNGSSNGGSGADTSSSNVPTADEQQMVFGSMQFENNIIMHVPPDDFASAQALAPQNGTTVEWWTYIRSNVGCVQQGYGTIISHGLVPSVDNYNLDGNQLEATLEQSGMRAIQNYSLTLNPTPWGQITRSFACTVNTDKLAALTSGQNVHGQLDIPIGQRVCTRWTFVNHYDSPTPGQGNVKTFAGTFNYSVKPLVTGVQFSGEGTASVKMSLNPDNGHWLVANFEMHDPPLSVNGFSGAEPGGPAQTSCPGP